MTSTLIRLHRTLRSRLFKKNPTAIMMTILVSIYALGGLLATSFLLATAIQSQSWSILPFVLGIGCLGYLVVESVIPSGEHQIDVRTLAPLPVDAKQILPALAVIPLLTSRGVLALICAVVTAVVGTLALPGAWGILWSVATLINTAVAILLSELLKAAISGSSRSNNDKKNVLGVVLVFVILLGFNQIQSSKISPEALAPVGEILGWLPIASAGGAVASILAGAAWWIIAAKALITIATFAAGILGWKTLVAEQLRNPNGTSHATTKTEKVKKDKEHHTLLIPGAPHTASGYIYSRAVRYFRRDSRLFGTLVMLLIVFAFFVFKAVSDQPEYLYVAAFIIALLSGISASNDLGYDGPPIWSLIVTGTPVRAWIRARHLASITPSIVFQALIIILVLALAPDKTIALLVCLASLGAFLSSATIGLLFTSFNAFPVAPPGTNPWTDKSGYSGPAMLSAFGSFIGVWFPLAPGAILLGFGYLNSSQPLLIIGAILAIGIPAIIYYVAYVLCIRHIEKNLPELFNKVGHWVG
ncbi:Transport protein [Corynebacterium pseudotuberculosis]|uniref:hypothetical protein n=1 Tax=Corynebacterium pseudotuberculosis TaxID=1719 RepID=UPI0007DB32DF|nr:hypothetical protein [Corynebacterium pseudotuberculosis]ANH25549.1 Transport protein [Corynebacterium pseudotuberculosis]